MDGLETLSSLSRPEAERLLDGVLKTSDVALVVDRAGVVREVIRGHDVLGEAGSAHWAGRPLTELVAAESRETVAEMLEAAGAQACSRVARVLHPARSNAPIPIRYCASPAGRESGVLLVGRDLRPLARLETQVIAAQQSLERDHDRQREAETRYRVLFQTVAEPIMIVAAGDGRILDVNPLASRLLGESREKLVGRSLANLVPASDRPRVADLLAATPSRAGGRVAGADATVALGAPARRVRILAEPFRAYDRIQILLRLREQSAGEPQSAFDASVVSDLIRATTEAVVVTDASGAIIWANPAFERLAPAAEAGRLRGTPLAGMLEEFAAGFGTVLEMIRHDGRFHMPSATMRAQDGSRRAVDISAVAIPCISPPGIGFVLRPVEASRSESGHGPAEPLATPEEIAGMIGQTPMKELVHESSDVIERACIEAALRLTGGNRAAAAEALGLSRQSLYVKLRRFGLIGAHQTGA